MLVKTGILLVTSRRPTCETSLTQHFLFTSTCGFVSAQFDHKILGHPVHRCLLFYSLQQTTFLIIHSALDGAAVWSNSTLLLASLALLALSLSPDPSTTTGTRSLLPVHSSLRYLSLFPLARQRRSRTFATPPSQPATRP